jgi:hypothetical protein
MAARTVDGPAKFTWIYRSGTRITDFALKPPALDDFRE